MSLRAHEEMFTSPSMPIERRMPPLESLSRVSNYNLGVYRWMVSCNSSKKDGGDGCQICTWLISLSRIGDWQARMSREQAGLWVN